MATDETKETSSPSQTANSSPKSKLNWILVALLIVASGGAGFFGWQYFKGKNANAHGLEEAKEGEHHEASKATGENGKGRIDKSGHAIVQEGATINFEPFLVNLADKDESRYLKTTIRIMVVDKETAEKITAGEVLVSRMRDTILSILSTKLSSNMVTVEGKQNLKKEIIEKLNTFLPNEPAHEVFFTDFVVQL